MQVRLLKDDKDLKGEWKTGFHNPIDSPDAFLRHYYPEDGIQLGWVNKRKKPEDTYVIPIDTGETGRL